jgi:hypothetical protein
MSYVVSSVLERRDSFTVFTMAHAHALFSRKSVIVTWLDARFARHLHYPQRHQKTQSEFDDRLQADLIEEEGRIDSKRQIYKC